MKFKYETNYRFPALKDLRKHILAYAPGIRSIAAEIVRGHGFEAHVGGHHVAVMQDGVRLAIITNSLAPDWN